MCVCSGKKKKVCSGSLVFHADTLKGPEETPCPLPPGEVRPGDFLPLPLSGASPGDKNVHVPSAEKEKVLGPDGGRDRQGLVGAEGLPAPRKRRQG